MFASSSCALARVTVAILARRTTFHQPIAQFIVVARQSMFAPAKSGTSRQIRQKRRRSTTKATTSGSGASRR
jgi:hypothetical protein